MRRALEIFLLLIFISLTILYSIFFYYFNVKDPDNSINHVYRKYVLPYPPIRWLLRLHQFGDARFDYGTRMFYTKLDLTIYTQGLEQLQSETLPQIEKEIGKVVSKPAGITLHSPVPIPDFSASVSDKDLFNLLRQYPPRVSLLDRTIPLRIFVLKKYTPSPTYAGIVVNDNAIFLFMDAIRDVSDKQPSTKNTEIATILHEFAHLLGADHIKVPDCMLSEEVENITDYGVPTVMTDEYCQVDIDEIRRVSSL